MAKRKAPRMPRPSSGGSGLGGGNMLSQLQKVQEEMERVQEALGQEMVEAAAGGGAVKVVVNGRQEIQSVAIDPEVVDPEDVEILEDMIVAAVREAMGKAGKLAAERMGMITGGLGIPGLM